MSRTRHSRGKPSKYQDHRRKDKEWKRDSQWKPSELPYREERPRPERRSPRTRLR